MNPSDAAIPQPTSEMQAQARQVHLAMFESSSDCVKILDLDGSLRAMNRNGQCSMEIDDFNAICGAMWPVLWPEASRGLVHDAMRAARDGGMGQFEAFCPTAKGTPKWWNVVVSPMLGVDGDVTGLVSISRDITETRVAREREQALAARLRFALDTARYGEWEFDAASGLFNFNQRSQQCLGLADGRLACRLSELLALVHESDRDAVAEAIAAALDGAPLQAEFRVMRPDAGPRWLSLRGSRYLGGAQQAGHNLTGLLSDITEQASMTAALRAANLEKDRLMASLERQVGERTAERDRMWRLSTDIMLVADFNATIVAVNPAWRTVLGHVEAALLGSDFMAMVHPDDRAATLQEVGRLSNGLTTLRFENRYRHSDGSFRSISWTAVPDAGLLHAVGRDISDEKHAADALRHSEMALRQSQKMESIGKLTGGVAHDFNNVLQIISGNLQLLQMTAGDSGPQAQRLATAALAVERGAKLSAQLLAFARRQPLKPVVADLGRLMLAMDQLLKRALGENVDVELAVAPALWHTLVDPNQLENVVLNLAINARDAMQGRGRLTIELGNATLDDAYCGAHSEVASGQYVLLAVSDTGSGIAPALLEQIFEPFFTTKREGEGTGLGLSMAYGFVKQSGGHIKVYSEIGNGTTFKLYLPRSEACIEALPEPLGGPVVGGGETILVVEDDLQVQVTVVEMLKGLGYTVFKADDAQSALAIVNSGLPIDLLFTDVVMPGPLRSPELVRQARLRLPDLAVLFTSGYTHNAIVHGGRLDAGVELLSKPYRREELARKIRYLLANREHVMSLASDKLSLADAAPLAGEGAGARRRILLVEDNHDARCLTAELLTCLGHQVDAVASAEEALDYLGRGAVDVLLTDISLPRMSGSELAQQVRRDHPAVAIVFASGHDKRNAGIADLDATFLLKPFSLAQLEAALGV